MNLNYFEILELWDVMKKHVDTKTRKQVDKLLNKPDLADIHEINKILKWHHRLGVTKLILNTYGNKRQHKSLTHLI